jgi:hypothetical protein
LKERAWRKGGGTHKERRVHIMRKYVQKKEGAYGGGLGCQTGLPTVKNTIRTSVPVHDYPIDSALPANGKNPSTRTQIFVCSDVVGSVQT